MVAVGEAAELQVLLTLRDQLSPGLATVNARVAELQSSSSLGGLSGLAAKVESGFAGVGNALSHAAGQIGGLIKNIGLFGGAIGLFSAGGALKSAIDTANTMAKSIETLTALTGESATTISQLLAVFERFGVSTDTATTRLAFLEKTLGTLANNTKALTALQKTYGISLTDSSGNIVDVNTALQRLADYMNGSASAADKAKVASTLLGRGYDDLLPVLSQGAAGIAAVEAQANALGNTLNQQQVDQLMQYQTAMRDMGEALQGLGLQIAVALVPSLETLAQNITSFVSTNRGNIVQFFQNAAKWAGELAGVVSKDVVPVLQAVVGWWNGLPGSLKEILIAGFVTGKVTKWLFGFSEGDLLKAGASLAGSFIAKIVGSTVGSSVASSLTGGLLGAVKPVPVWVTNPGFGGAGGAAEGVAGAGAAEGIGTGLLATIGTLGAGIAAILGAYWLPQILANENDRGAQGVPVKGANGTYGTLSWQQLGLTGLSSVAANAGLTNPTSSGGTGGNVGQDQYTPGATSSGGTGGNVGQDQYSAAAIAAQKLAIAAQAAASVIHDWSAELKAADKALKTIRDPKSAGVGAAADSLVTYFSGRSLGALGGIKNANDKISGDIKTLTADERAAAARGDTATANKLKSDIQALKDRLAALQAQANAKLTTIANKPTNFTAITTVNSVITTRSIDAASFRIKTYGNLVIS